MIKCLLADDEQPARELLARHLSDLPEFEIVASVDNGLDAFTFLQKNVVDLAFLDIRMPKISGLELVRSLKIGPAIIFTTAYREFAANAYELDVLDYLVKPITREKFNKSVLKFMQYHHLSTTRQPIAGHQEAWYFFKVGRQQVKIFLKDILFMEGLSDYIKVHTAERYYIASEKLGFMEEKLPGHSFARIHKSFIIALDKITSYSADQVSIGSITLPLGRVYKNILFKKLEDKAPG